MNKANVINGLKEFGSSVIDGVREDLQTQIDQEIQEAVDLEFSRGIDRAVAALFEVTEDRVAIVTALQKPWGIGIKEAEERVQWEARTRAPMRSLERFLKEKKNYTDDEARKFMRGNKVVSLLRQDPELSTMKPEQLYKELQKRS